MEWTKVYIETTEVGVETVSALLMEFEINSVEIINSRERIADLEKMAGTWDYADDALLDSGDERVFVVFYADAEDSEELISRIRENLTSRDFSGLDVGSLLVSTEIKDDETWLHEWKKFFKPIKIGRVVIVPEWENYAATDEAVFKINPGSAFGTGQHQSTQLSLLALQEHLRKGNKILDLGCGSGILSLTALLLGADSAFAIDIDPVGAITTTKTNIELNKIPQDKVTLRAGNVLTNKELADEVLSEQYDVVIANIVADVVCELTPFVYKVLRPGGTFISSGIITEREADVKAVFSESDFDILKRYECDGWVCIAAEKSIYSLFEPVPWGM